MADYNDRYKTRPLYVIADDIEQSVTLTKTRAAAPSLTSTSRKVPTFGRTVFIRLTEQEATQIIELLRSSS